MRRRWSLILPIYGLLLFSLVTLESIQMSNFTSRHSGAFYWSVIRLDSDPLDMHRQQGTLHPCDTNSDCVEFDLTTAWVSPGLLDKALFYPAFPAFLLEVAMLAGLGVNQIAAFFVSMPLLITVWFYFLGSLLDRWHYKRQLKKASATV